MLTSVIVGFGRAGAGLHLPALRRLSQSTEGLRSTSPVLAFDPSRSQGESGLPKDVRVLASYDELARAADPNAVVHVCTPPSTRNETIGRLAALGYRKFIVEKPLASSRVELAALRELKLEYGLEILVVGNFIVSALTRRIAEIARAGELGSIRHLAFDQRKPRFGRSLTDRGSLTAFDVEIPHSIGAALVLANASAEVLEARCTDLLVGSQRISSLGTATLTMRHTTDALTTIYSDLGSPLRKRSVDVRLERGDITGHYPVSEGDSHAQLSVYDDRGREVHREVLLDDSFLTFMTRAYRQFLTGERAVGDFELNERIVKLLSDAKERSGVAKVSETIARPNEMALADA